MSKALVLIAAIALVLVVIVADMRQSHQQIGLVASDKSSQHLLFPIGSK